MVERDYEEIFKKRKERLEKVYSNKRPDRVPFELFPSLSWIARYVGFSNADLCFNYEAILRANMKIHSDFNIDGIDFPIRVGAVLDLSLMLLAFMDYPDMAISLSGLTGPMHDILRDRYSRWPGRELPENAEPQFIGGKFMEDNEYSRLAEDSLGFLNNVVLPRVFEALSKPSSPEAHAAWIRLGMELQKRYDNDLRRNDLLLKYGWPVFPTALGVKPLDYISDHLRHPTNLMIDLYKRPGDVLRAVNVIEELTIKFLRTIVPTLMKAAQDTFKTKIIIIAYPLHLNSMLSPKMYDKFYWPSLKRVLIETINLGAVPSIFFEGDHTPHLETILELPKGKVYGMFEKTNLRVVRKILGDHIIIGGGIPTSVFAYGSKEQVFEEVCKLLKDIKEPGGFIFTGTGTPLPSGAKVENILAAVEAIKKYGTY
ncbi:MAG: uroporphyrinogen decarboxylase family protein [Candidatus Bathyarchaeia archaeon]